MRERAQETMIEIPLSEYRQLVEDLTEARLCKIREAEEHFKLKFEFDTMKNAHAKLSNLYEQVVVELESYKMLYDKEEE